MRNFAGWERAGDDVGGTIGGLATVPVTGQSLVFAATSVGVFRSSDAGRMWQSCAEHNPVPFAAIVAPSALFEHDRTLFVCAADGLHRSRDGGKSSQPVLIGSRALSVASALVGREDHDLVLFAGTETEGVLRSEDQGRTWTGANVGLLDLTVLAVALSPRFTSDRTGFLGTASGVYRTRNAGNSWREVSTGLREPAVQCVAISPTFADDRLVLAGTEADGLLRSDDAGGTWHRPAELVDQGIAALAFSTRYPSKPTIVAAVQSGIAVSEDSGRTWRWLVCSLPGMVLSLTFAATSTNEVLLAGLHRYGIARSEDEGANWELSNTGMSARMLTGLVLAPGFDRNRTLIATGPEDGVRVSMDGGRSWVERTSGLGEQPVLSLALSPDYAADRTLYVATPDGIHVSRDGTAGWSAVPGGSSPAQTVATASVPNARPSVVALAPDGGLLVSEDAGNTWRRHGHQFGGAVASGLWLSPGFGRDEILFVATRRAGSPQPAEIVLWRSADGGEHWDPWLDQWEVRDAPQVIALAVSPDYASDEMVFVGLGARVLKPARHAREVRAGRSRPVWHAKDLDQGVVAVTAIALSPAYAQDQTVFVATNAGVLISRDGGESYRLWSEGLVPPGVLALTVSPNYPTDRLVYALGPGGIIWRRRGPD
jgi:photosystem II stability/assembly factor-like uncharacterized protein